MDLTDNFRKQSEHHGTEIVTETISKVDLSKRPFQAWPEGTEDEPVAPLAADAVIIATGATAKRLNLPGEDKYWQSGISACAVCDGAIPIVGTRRARAQILRFMCDTKHILSSLRSHQQFRNKPLAVVGGGDSAAEEATFLTKYASKVYLLVRRDVLRASKAMANRVLNHPKIEILWNTAPVEAKGDGRLLNALTVQDTKTSAKKDIAVNGLFYAIGHVPNTAPFKETSLAMDADGYVITKPGTSYTNIEGVFACGDVQDKVGSLKQAAVQCIC